MNYSIFRPGTDYVRTIVAKALSASPTEAVNLASERWGRDAAQIVKAAVPGMEAVDLLDTGLLASAQAEYVLEADRDSIYGRLAGLRMVSPNTPYCVTSEAATGYWLGESKPIKASRLAFERNILRALKLASLVIGSKEALRSDERAVELLRRDMLRADRHALDLALIDPNNNGVAGESPASLLAGAPSVAATANPADDLAALLELFTGDYSAAAWVMHPKVAAQISGLLGLRSELGLRGGLLLGLPALVSSSVPITSDGSPVALIDASGIAAVDEGASVETATAGMVELDDEPTGATDTPSGATAHAVSLFQADAVAVKMTRRVNFENGRPGGVVYIDGANYMIGV